MSEMKTRMKSCLLSSLVLSLSVNTLQASQPNGRIIVEVNTNGLLRAVAKPYGVLVAPGAGTGQKGVTSGYVRDPNDPNGFLFVIDYSGIQSVDPNVMPEERIQISEDYRIPGRVYELFKDGRMTGFVHIVVVDPNAVIKMLKRFNSGSTAPEIDFNGELGPTATAFTSDGFLRIANYACDNVVVKVYGPSKEGSEECGLPEDFTMKLARGIRESLLNDTDNVRRGDALKMPRIMAVDIEGEMRTRSTITAHVRVAIAYNPTDPFSEEYEIVRSSPFHVPVVIPTAQDEGGTEREMTFRVTYTTPGGAVAEKDISLAIPLTPHEL